MYFNWFEEVVVVGGLGLVEEHRARSLSWLVLFSLVVVCPPSLIAPQALASGCVGILCHSWSGFVFCVVPVEEPFRGTSREVVFFSFFAV